MRLIFCCAALAYGCATNSDDFSNHDAQPLTMPTGEMGVDFSMSMDSEFLVDTGQVDGFDYDATSHDASEAADVVSDLNEAEISDASAVADAARDLDDDEISDASAVADAIRDFGGAETFDAAVPDGLDMSSAVDQSQQADETNPCEGMADNHLLREGTVDDCLYADPCVETGTANRIDLICMNGEAVENTVSSICERQTDGILVQGGTFGACDYADECSDSGRRIKLDLVCEAGEETEIERIDTLGCARTPNQSCSVVECVTHSQCDADEFCVCPGYWIDIDGERSCSDFVFEPRVCLPCSGLSGPVCMFDALPERGITYPSLCDAPRFPPYLLSGECPPECDPSSPVSTCPNSQDFCTAEGRCEPR